MKTKTILFTGVFLLMAGIGSLQAQNFDLTGVWTGNDGGTYYLRQINNVVWWFGEDDAENPSWSNIAHGRLNGKTINLEWTDVPKGSITQNGTLVIKVVDNNKLILQTEVGGFGGSEWTRKTE
jgi:hypothetical protein